MRQIPWGYGHLWSCVQICAKSPKNEANTIGVGSIMNLHTNLCKISQKWGKLPQGWIIYGPGRKLDPSTERIEGRQQAADPIKISQKINFMTSKNTTRAVETDAKKVTGSDKDQ